MRKTEKTFEENLKDKNAEKQYFKILSYILSNCEKLLSCMNYKGYDERQKFVTFFFYSVYEQKKTFVDASSVVSDTSDTFFTRLGNSCEKYIRHDTKLITIDEECGIMKDMLGKKILYISNYDTDDLIQQTWI